MIIIPVEGSNNRFVKITLLWEEADVTVVVIPAMPQAQQVNMEGINAISRLSSPSAGIKGWVEATDSVLQNGFDLTPRVCLWNGLALYSDQVNTMPPERNIMSLGNTTEINIVEMWIKNNNELLSKLV